VALDGEQERPGAGRKVLLRLPARVAQEPQGVAYVGGGGLDVLDAAVGLTDGR